jgi:AmiR/NasT family two-component response regulator
VRGESVEAALKRLQPDCVVIEAMHPAVRAAETYDTAAATGAGVIVFAPSHPWGEIADIVQKHPGATLVWPRDGESLAARLEFALGAACARPRANAPD